MEIKQNYETLEIEIVNTSSTEDIITYSQPATVLPEHVW